MDAHTLIILGGGGDLTRRLLLPGLAGILARDPERRVEIIGASHSPKPEDEWRDLVRLALEEGLAEVGADGAAGSSSAIDAAVENARWVEVDATDRDALAALLAEARHAPVLYFALPPSVTVAAVAALRPEDIPDGTIFALEKPFGHDGDSAAELNRMLALLLPEERTFRVDHFLGKSTVLNLLGLRFANRLLESVWNRENVQSISISYDETLALEGRAGYYDGAGALVDMIHSHLLLVASLMTMEAPSSLDADDLRGAMAQALRATRILDDDPVVASRRARYTAGTVDGTEVRDYAAEDGVDPDRGTETLAELTVTVENSRWAGVPITLRSGKALDAPDKDAVLTLRPVAHLPRGLTGAGHPPQVRISLSPEHLAVELDLNGAGDPYDLDRVRLESDFGAGDLTAYGEVLDGILAGDPTLSVRGDVAEQCWRLIDPVLAAWREDAVPLEEYAAGSRGPDRWSSAG